MAVTYNPSYWTGTQFQEIFSEVLHANNTVGRRVARVIDNIKSKTKVTAMSGEIAWGAYESYVTEAVVTARTGSLAFADAYLEPEKMMAFDTFNPDDLRGTRFEQDMLGGAANVVSNDFERTVLSYQLPRSGKSYERLFWTAISATSKAAIAASSIAAAQKAWAAAQTANAEGVDGIIARQILATVAGVGSAPLTVTGTTITSSNVVTEYNKIITALPDAVLADPRCKIIAPEGDKKIIKQGNLAQTYRDAFVIDGDNISFLDTPIEFVSLNSGAGQVPRTAGVAGETGNFVLGTDLLSDADMAEINRVNNMSDKRFFKMTATLSAAVLIPQQTVIYV